MHDPGLRSQQEQEIFLSATNAQTVLSPVFNRYLKFFPPEKKRPGRQADHSLQSAVRKGWMGCRSYEWFELYSHFSYMPSLLSFTSSAIY
jgi:hypothetical protein